MEFEYFNVVGPEMNFVAGKCKAKIIATAESNYRVSISSFKNIKHIIMTDKMIENCVDYNWEICPADSGFCKSKKIIILRNF